MLIIPLGVYHDRLWRSEAQSRRNTAGVSQGVPQKVAQLRLRRSEGCDSAPRLYAQAFQKAAHAKRPAGHSLSRSSTQLREYAGGAGRADEAGTALAEAFHLFDHRGHLRAPEHFRARRVGGLYLVAAAAGGKKVKTD